MRAICCLVLLASISFAQTAEESLNMGVTEFKQGNYAAATELFRRAIDLGSSNVNAHLYLGTALQMQFVPFDQSPENQKFADQAKEEYRKVLDRDSGNTLALSSLATLAYNQKKFDESREWYRKVIAVDPNNKVAYYTLGVIAWMEWLPVDRQARTDSGQNFNQGPIGNARLRNDLRAKWMPSLDEGIQNVQTALRIDPQYDDAMSYLNLLIRYRADLLDTPEEYKIESERADIWVQKAVDTKRAKNASSQPQPAVEERPSNGEKAIRIGGAIAQANLVTKVEPVYPALARQARITGTVRLRVIIDPDGHVENVTLMAGHPLLVQSAMEAVKQWVYKPTVLNGQPVKVATMVEVTFALIE